MPVPKLSAHHLRRVAVEAGCDPRTVKRFLSGARVASTSEARIQDALKACAIAIQPPDQEPAVREEKAR